MRTDFNAPRALDGLRTWDSVYRWLTWGSAVGVLVILGGVIVSLPVGLADPSLAYWLQSGNLVFMLLLGGYTNFFGPILGAAVFIFFQDQLTSYTEYWRLTFGIVLAVIVIFFPNGLMGILDALRRRPHPTHMNLDEGIALAESLGLHRVLFTHLSHDFGHAATKRELPPNVFLAYDGLKLSL